MRQGLQKGAAFSPARRHLLKIAGAAASAMPFFAMGSSARAKDHRHEDSDESEDDDHHCFLRGTRIQTPEGEKAIEELVVGELVETTNGPLPIKWIAHRVFESAGPACRDADIVPVKVARFALNDQY